MQILAFLSKVATAAFLLGGVALLRCAPAAAADSECRDVPASQLKVYVARNGALRVQSATQADMARASDDVGVVADWNAHPLLLIEPRYASQVTIDERTIQGEGGTFCAAPKLIQVRLGVENYLVYIDDRAYGDDCVRELMIRHATSHLAADNRAIAAFVAAVRQPIAEHISKLKRVPFGDEREAIENFKSGMGDILSGMLAAFSGERPRVYADINRSLEGSEVEASCNGRLRALQTEARFRGERADAAGDGHSSMVSLARQRELVSWRMGWDSNPR